MKTIENEIIERYPNCKSIDEFTSIRIQDIIDREKKAFIAGIDLAQRWIPVEEELPEVNEIEFSEEVLTKNLPGKVKMEFYDEQNKEFTTVRHDSQVTHWRPIERK